MFTLFTKNKNAPKESTEPKVEDTALKKLSLASLEKDTPKETKESTEGSDAIHASNTTTEAEDDGLSLEAIDLDTMPPKNEDAEDEDSVHDEVHTKTLQDTTKLPEEYQAAVPDSLSQDLQDLAQLTESFSKITDDESGLMGIFTEEQEAKKEANIEEDKSTNTQKSESTKKDSVKKTKKTSKKDDATSSDKTSLLAQLKSVMNQQKTLMQKLAAIGNIPVFDPKKFDQLMEALPAIVAWHKAGGAVPQLPPGTGQPGNTPTQTAASTISTTQQNNLANGQKVSELSASDLHNESSQGGDATAQLVAKENEEQLRKNMGIALEQTTSTDEGKKVDVKKLSAEVDSEGFLESTVQMTQETAPVGAGVTMIGEEEPKESPAQRAKREKIEAAQEKAWAEEAKRRAKDLEKKRKEAEKQMKKNKISGKNIKITAPQKKKVGKLEAFVLKLNYFGLSKQRDEFVDNLGVMMDAGLPLLDALRTLEVEAKQKPYKKLLSKVVVGVETGSPLWRAMDSTKFFEDQQVSMIKVGEEAGNLVENLRYLGEQSAKQRELKAKVKTAMIYPIIVGVMLTLIIFGLGMFVLPNLIDVIFSLGVPLPFITRMIVAFTGVFSEHGTILLPSVMGGAFVLLMLHKYTKFKIVTQWIIMKVPGIGVLVNESVLSQFGVTMGGLLQAGVPVTDALESLASTTSIARYQKFYYLLLAQVKLGDSFATAFSKIKMTDKCFPGSMQQLIRTGEKSGSLTKIMLKLAEIHDKKATDVAEKLPVILEPMLLLFIGSLVGTIALGVLAPIYSIVGNVG